MLGSMTEDERRQYKAAMDFIKYEVVRLDRDYGVKRNFHQIEELRRILARTAGRIGRQAAYDDGWERLSSLQLEYT